MEARLVQAAQDLGEPIDPLLSAISHDPATDVHSIVLSATRTPDAESERLLVESGLHAAVLSEFSELPRDKIDVRVLVPPVLASADPPPAAPTSLGVSDWIDEQRSECDTFIRVYATQMLYASMRRALDSYPWRDHDSMRARLPWLTATYLGATTSLNIVGTIHEAVDALLPPFRGLLHPLDCDHVVHEATRWLGREPRSVLELYEEVHRRVVTLGRTGQRNAVLLLYERLFLY